MPNMKALSLKVKKLYTMLKFADGQTDRQTDRVITIGGSKVMVKVTCSKFMVPSERSSHNEHTYQI